jgi:hypothetical protein
VKDERKRWWKHAFAVEDDAPIPPEVWEKEEQILEKIAAKVVEKRMAAPAVIFLESVKPLNFVGAQVMAFVEPFVTTLFPIKDYDPIREMFERRDSIERLLTKIEAKESERHESEKTAKAERKAERRSRRRTGKRR